MAYEALYTRVRPKNLSQLIGQDHISSSLSRALNQDRLSHAYLLVGTRGTGKTSTARILARAINCDTLNKARENKQILSSDTIPCNECEACVNFKNSPDNVEFDAASNRSVEDVSRLLSTAYLAPLQSRFKTFIIDEVHMLSFEAVNSILKLIEEPPKNVIFFLATTEFNKVPLTIRSRCQILNFKLIPQDIIAEHLKKIASNLDLNIEEAAVQKISRIAKGSMRDALTYFDQCYSMVNVDSETLTLNMIDDTLGLVSDADLDLIIESAKEKDRKKLMESISNAFKSGLTAGNIAESLITRLRDRITYSSDEKAYDIALYNDMIDKLRQSIIEMQGSGIPEIILETSLFKFVSSPLTAFEKKTENVDVIFIDETSTNPENGVIPTSTNTIANKGKVININEKRKDFDINVEITDEDNPDVGKKIFDKLINYFEKKDGIDITPCMKSAEVVKFKSGIISLKFKNSIMAGVFKDHIKLAESVLKERTNVEIKLQIDIDDDVKKTSIEKNDTTLAIDKLNPDDRQYLKSMMKLFDVDYNDVKPI